MINFLNINKSENNINLLIDENGNIFDEDGNFLGNYNYYYEDINYNDDNYMDSAYVFYTSDNNINPPTRRAISRSGKASRVATSRSGKASSVATSRVATSRS